MTQPGTFGRTTISPVCPGGKERVGGGIGDRDVEPVVERVPGAARHERVARTGVRHDVALGHAEPLHERHAEALLEGRAPLGRDRHRHHQPQPVIAIAIGRGLAEDELGNDAEAVRDRGLGRAHLLEPGRGPEALGHQRLGARDQAAQELHEQGVGVEQGHADEVAIGRGERRRLRQPEAGQVAVPVRDEHALRRPGRAGGVHDHRDVAGLGRHQIRRRPERPQLGPREPPRPGQARGRRGGRVADDDEGLGGHRTRGDSGEVRGQAVLEDDDARLGVAQLVLEERAAQRGVDRHPDRAELHGREEQADRLRAVADEAQHAIAGLHAEGGQRPGQLVRPRIERAVGEGLPVLEADERARSLRAGLPANQVDERPLAPRGPDACRLSHQGDGIPPPGPGAGRRSLRRATSGWWS